MSNQKRKIVIIEDEEILNEVLSKKLATAGYEISSAKNGEEGLRLIDQVKPDLILLDLILPIKNGYEVLGELNKKYGKNIMPPVIIISNSGQSVEFDKASSLGAKDFIVKAEFTPEEVISKVNKLIGTSTVSKEAMETKASGQTSAASTAGAKVLIIEDDQFLRDLLKTKLEKENFKVTTAIDGPGGMDMIIKDKPDVILLDIILPGIDGFEILKRVRTNSNMQIATTPVVLLSNLGQEADVEKGKALGADDYLIKSNFTIDEIIEKLQNILATKK